MKHPLAILARKELRQDPWAFLAPGIVTVTCTIFLHAVLTFLMSVLRDPQLGGPNGATQADNITGAAMVGVFSIIPAIVVLTGTGTGAVANLQSRIVRWKLAGASPFQIRLVVLGQFVASCLTGAAVGAIVSIPLLPMLTGVIMTMAGLPGKSLSFDLLAMIGSILLCGLVAFAGAWQPAHQAAQIQPGPALREEEPMKRRHPVFRLFLAMGFVILTTTQVIQVFGSTSEDNVEGVMNAVLFGPAMLVCTLAAVGPWVIPTLLQWGRLVPSRMVPAWFLALQTCRANPQRTSSTTMPFMVAASVSSIFTGLFATWQQALDASGSGIALNWSDTVALVAPSVVMGIMGAAGQMMLSRSGRVRNFASMRLTGAPRKTLIVTAVSEGMLAAGVVIILSTTVAVLTSVMTAHVMTAHVISAEGLSARPVIDWALQMLIVGIGLALTAGVGVHAAITASKGNPRQHLLTS